MSTYSTVGNWRVDLTGPIGKGGYSKVYRCKSPDEVTGQAAIKIFNKTTSPNTVERELKSLTAIAGVPHAPQILDSGTTSQGCLYIVTELVRGLSLNTHIRRNGPLSYQESRVLLQSLLDLLRQVHGMGLAHLDIGPPNIVINECNVALLDWGCSQWINEERLEVIRANREIVAPECCYGSFGPATDFYALGLTAVYAMSGEWPYHFDSVEDPSYRLLAHSLERPILPDGVPQELRPLVYSWLNKDPERRHVCYELELAMREAEGSAADFLNCKEIRQLQHEFNYLQVGALHDIPYIQYEYACNLLDSSRTAEAIYWLERACRQGSARAASRLALISQRRR